MLIAVDFDECLIETHFSRDFTQAFFRGRNLGHADFLSPAADALQAVLDLYKGIDRDSLQALADRMALEVRWRTGAKEFLTRMAERDNCKTVIVSSGLDIPINAFLSLHGLHDIPVYSCALSFTDGVCAGIERLVSAGDKKAFVEKAVQKHGRDNVFAIGHNEGDKGMMTAARSICIPSGYGPCMDIAEHVADDFCNVALFRAGALN